MKTIPLLTINNFSRKNRTLKMGYIQSLCELPSLSQMSGREEVALKRIYERENYNQDDIKHFKEVGFVNVCFN